MLLKNHDDSSHFISLSDIMTALMMVFMFISVAIITQIQKENVSGLRESQQKRQQHLAATMIDAVDSKLDRWGASIDADNLTITFVDSAGTGAVSGGGSIADFRSRTLFDVGSSELSPEFKQTLSEFFPVYIKWVQKNKDLIQEIRIEGHADSTGKAGQTERESYFFNMALSQARTISVLEYCMTLPNFTNTDFENMKEFITANGFSFSHVIKDASGRENRAASRRVEFRALPKSVFQTKSGDL